MTQLVTDNPQLAANDLVTAKQTAELLHKHYPGHAWAVSCEEGVVEVRNLALSGEWGFRLFRDQAFSGSEYDKKVMRAGGEILERYKLRRGMVNQDHLQELQTDFSGRTLFAQ